MDPEQPSEIYQTSEKTWNLDQQPDARKKSVKDFQIKTEPSEAKFAPANENSPAKGQIPALGELKILDMKYDKYSASSSDSAESQGEKIADNFR